MCRLQAKLLLAVKIKPRKFDAFSTVLKLKVKKFDSSLDNLNA